MTHRDALDYLDRAELHPIPYAGCWRWEASSPGRPDGSEVLPREVYRHLQMPSGGFLCPESARRAAAQAVVDAQKAGWRPWRERSENRA